MLSPHQVAAAKNQDGLLACLVVEGLKIRVRSEGMLKAGPCLGFSASSEDRVGCSPGMVSHRGLHR
jgi:hypothetical protein